ncbi:MAG: hypothetical protein CMH32_04605 [Micavibrio sp.]|nr:hypothetical protein [Micavibrio sp.]
MARLNARPIAASFCLLAASLIPTSAIADQSTNQGRQIDLSDWKSQYLEETYCAVQLVLLMDVSRSMVDTEYDLQIQGTANALLSKRVKELILDKDAVCITAVQFSDTAQQVTPWTRILYERDLETYAAQIASLPRMVERGGTDIYEGLNTAIDLIANSPYDKTGKMVIDITGDGKDSNIRKTETLVSLYAQPLMQGTKEYFSDQIPSFNFRAPQINVPNAPSDNGSSFDWDDFEIEGDIIENIRSSAPKLSMDMVTKRAENLGIQINGVAILDMDTPDLEGYYRDNIITYNGFVMPAKGWEDFARAIQKKLEREMIANAGSKLPTQLRGPNHG